MKEKNSENYVNTKECPHCKGEIQIDATKCRHCGEWIDKIKEPNPHKGLTAFGYMFAIFGGWLGLVTGLYLLTRENKKAKFHGKVITGISGLFIIIMLISVLGHS